MSDDPSSPLATAGPAVLGPGNPGALARGATLGRYVVLDLLGAGAMGVVYAAYDPELDRRVAVKLLQSIAGDPEEASRGRARLLREGQAMARLSHPNVIAVHDVGTYEGQVFVAMELVEGGTLRAWLDGEPGADGGSPGEPRRWREIVSMFVQTGHGLAAAHAAGLVHRDFKPDNVLVGRDGRARVVDFGLARAGDAPLVAAAVAHDSHPVARARSHGGLASLAAQLSEHGALVGTPLYMAPEQMMGERTDASSDQFSFCVSLFEALYGIAPFEGADLFALSASVQSGKVREPPPGARAVPGWVRQVVKRGLEVEPKDRYPSMNALLRDLERDPGRARRRALAILAGAAVVAGVSLLVGRRIAARPPPCSAGAAVVESEWNAAVADRVRGAFVATGRAYAADTFDRVRQHLDGYVKEWSRAHVAVCEAERAGSLSVERARDADECFADRARELRALVGAFEKTTDATVVGRAIGATDRLTAVDECETLDRSATRLERPSDPALRARVDELLGQITDARVRSLTGKPAIDALTPLVARAREAGYAPLESFASFSLAGELVNAARYTEAEDAYREALAAAARSHSTVKWFATVGALAGALALERRTSELPFYVPLLENIASFQGDDHRLAGGTLHDLAEVEEALGHPLRAAELANHSADLLESEGGIFRLISFFDRNLAARALSDAGRMEDAVATFTKVIPPLEREFGEHHPQVAMALKGRAYALAVVWRFDEAHADARRAEAIDTEVFSADWVGVSDCAESDGVAYWLDGQPREAIPRFERAIDLRTKAFGPDGVLVAYDVSNVAGAHLDAGDFDVAESSARRAVEILRKAFGKDHPALDSILEGFAYVELRLGHLDEAEAAASQALAERRARKDADLALLSPSLMVLSKIALRRGHVAEARRLATESEADYAGTQPSPGDRVATLIALGDAALADGDPAAAGAALESALSLLLASHAREGHPLIGTVKVRLGELALAAGDAAKAAPLFDAALASRASWTGDPEDVLRARFGRARASWELSGDRAQARRDASEVLARASAREVALPELRGAVKGWLASHD